MSESLRFSMQSPMPALQHDNYAFCTIDPNVGVVSVPDKRLDVACATMHHPKKFTPAVIEFVDIAGLVKGASKGEGLGNKFLVPHPRAATRSSTWCAASMTHDVIHVDGVRPTRLRDVGDHQYRAHHGSDLEIDATRRIDQAQKKSQGRRQALQITKSTFWTRPCATSAQQRQTGAHRSTARRSELAMMRDQ